MRSFLRPLLASAVLVGLATAPAFGATIQDLVKLKAAGLSDDVLVALIQSDGSVFHLKADDVIAIRKEGLSEKVILAMLATTFKKPEPAPARPAASVPVASPAATPPLVQVNDPYAPEVDVTAPQVVAPTQAPPPIVVNITQRVEQRVEAPANRADAYPTYTTYPYYPYYPVAVPVAVRPVPQRAAPVYWGFGGQLRPGTWKDK